jgi:hypothetical protein
MPGYNSQRTGHGPQLQNFFLFNVMNVPVSVFGVLFVCKCVLYCSHWVSTQLQLTNEYKVCKMTEKQSDGHVCVNATSKTKLWNLVLGDITKSKGKAILLQVLRGPKGSKRLRLPDFKDNRHTKVASLSALRIGHLYPHQIFLVIISVRSWVDCRAIVQLEGLCQWKIPMAPSGIDPATFCSTNAPLRALTSLKVGMWI